MNRKEKWNYMYSLLEDYYNDFGNSNVPVSYITKNNIALGVWVFNQRQLCKNNKLSVDRKNKLKILNFRFEVATKNNEKGNFDTRWEYMYNILENYYIYFGNSDVPRDCVLGNGIALGVWVHDQRVLFTKNKLSDDRINKLLQLEFAFISKRNLCSLYNIDYEKNKEVLSKLSHNSFTSRLYYLLDNYIDVVDDNENLHPIFGMNEDEVYLFTDFTQEKLNDYYNKKYMMNLIDSHYRRKENKSFTKIRRR